MQNPAPVAAFSDAAPAVTPSAIAYRQWVEAAKAHEAAWVAYEAAWQASPIGDAAWQAGLRVDAAQVARAKAAWAFEAACARHNPCR